MTDRDRRSAKELFRQWRAGDAEAGQAMAQRVADWYYAIATCRMGERLGRQPCRNACQRFGEGVGQVTEVRALVGWAHGIISEELSALGQPGDRIPDADEPSMYSANKSPKRLLAAARRALSDEVELLEAAYARAPDAERVKRLAAPLGGNPLGILRARYRVKGWLRDHKEVPFQVVPESPNLDRAPLPLYESGHMSRHQEEVEFEHWMLTDLDLCKDIAEFAPFTVGLRGGLPAPQVRASSRAAESSSARRALMIVGLGGLAIALFTIVAILIVVFAL